MLVKWVLQHNTRFYSTSWRLLNKMPLLKCTFICQLYPAKEKKIILVWDWTFNLFFSMWRLFYHSCEDSFITTQVFFFIVESQNRNFFINESQNRNFFFISKSQNRNFLSVKVKTGIFQSVKVKTGIFLISESQKRNFFISEY